MNLLDVVNRPPIPEPWAEGEKIPWHDAAFSQRMLAEHLSQAHNHASRRAATIEQHVAWVHAVVLHSQSAKVLDLGCGPGLYMAALARLGHECVGIDFAPASIAYAVKTAHATGLRCTYTLGDIRSTDFGVGFDLVMLTYGELNVFTASDAHLVLMKARQALVQGGQLLLEVHTLDAVRAIGSDASTWRSAEHGLFSDRPHLRLHECFWNEDQRTATERYYVIDAETSAVERYAQSMQGYTDAEYHALLHSAGFELCERRASFGDVAVDEDFVVLLAKCF